MKRLIIVSTKYELNPLLKRLGLDLLENSVVLTGSKDETTLLVSGVGTPATLMSLFEASTKAYYDEILQVGFCGSFDSRLSLGSLVEVVTDCFADLGFDNNGAFLALHKEMPDTAGLKGLMQNKPGTSLPAKHGVTVNTTSGSQSRIQQIKEVWHPDIETMEGAAALLFCIEKKIRYLQVRAVSNWVTPRNKSEWKMELAAENLSNWLIDYLNLTI